MNLWSLALRNVVRNRRRTLLTLGALGMSAAAMVMLGGYVNATIKGLQTVTVRQTGHLQVMVRGFLDFGRADPTRYAVQAPEALVARLQADAPLAPLLEVATPVLQVQGVAGQFASGLSSNFAGTGWLPRDRLRMLAWDGLGLRVPPSPSHLRDEHPQDGVIGVGLAQLLGLCDALEVAECLRAPAAAAPAGDPMSDDLARLSQQAAPQGPARPPHSGEAAIELLAAGSGGAPNVIRLNVVRAERQGVRELDMMHVGLPLALAQRLVFGAQPPGASAVVLQLKHTQDMPAARRRVEALLQADEATRGQGLEVRAFQDAAPTYNQVVGMFNTVFGFVSVLMAVVTVFSVANTVNMAVSERVGEIGTLQAMGWKPRHVRALFIVEGGLIGLTGAALGVGVALLVSAYGINQADLHWTPPGNSTGVPVGIDVAGSGPLCLGVVATLTLIACVSSWWPAQRASQLDIVEALRHV